MRENEMLCWPQSDCQSSHVEGFLLRKESLIQQRWVLTDLISNTSGLSSMMNVISRVHEERTS